MLERRGEHRLHGRVELRGHEQLRPRTEVTPGMASSSPAIRSPLARTWASSRQKLVANGARRRANDGVPAERAPVVARDEAAPGAVRHEQRAGRESSCKSLRQRQRIRPHAAVLPGEERSRAAHPRLHLVEHEQRAGLVGETAPAAMRNSLPATCTPPLSCTGPIRMQPTSGPQAAASEAASFRRAKRTPPSSGSNAARLSGWPVAASAPHVLPWNDPSSATMPGLPVALRAYLSAASTASAPELQKKDVAPPNR